MLASEEKAESKLSAQLNKLSSSSHFIRLLFISMAANDLSPPGSPGAGTIGSGAAAPLFPGGLGSSTTPMFIQNVLTPKTTMVSPYGNFLDISSKKQKLLWQEMIKPTNDHTLVDMNVANSRAIINLVQDKAITYRWQCYMCIPTKGTGALGSLPGTTPGGQPDFDTDLSDFKI